MHKCVVDVIVVFVVAAMLALHAMTYHDMLLSSTTTGSCLLQHRVRKVLNEYTDNELEETLKVSWADEHSLLGSDPSNHHHSVVSSDATYHPRFGFMVCTLQNFPLTPPPAPAPPVHHAPVLVIAWRRCGEIPLGRATVSTV